MREQHQNQTNDQNNKSIIQTTTPKLKKQPLLQESVRNNNAVIEAMTKT